MRQKAKVTDGCVLIKDGVVFASKKQKWIKVGAVTDASFGFDQKVQRVMDCEQTSFRATFREAELRFTVACSSDHVGFLGSFMFPPYHNESPKKLA